MRLPIPGWAAILMALILASCTAEAAPTTSSRGPSGTVPALSDPTTTTEAVPSETAQARGPTTTTRPPSFGYAVIAEERARRLTVLDLNDPCLIQGDCELEARTTFDLTERPHNLVAVGSVLYATHPAAGALSRVDLLSGEVMTIRIGSEPHDIKYSDIRGLLYTTDESGRQLLGLDPEDLSVIESVELPAEPHDLAIDGDTIWVTLLGRSELARVVGGSVELVRTGGSPHDVIVDHDGKVWFSNWGSDTLNVFHPASGETSVAPAGVVEPHHFAISDQGVVWVSDNGGSSVVGFGSNTTTVDVGPVPHHLSFAGELLVVAVSGSGEAVVIRGDQVVAVTALTTGLHGVAIVELPSPLAKG